MVGSFFLRKTIVRQPLSECEAAFRFARKPGSQRQRFALFFKRTHYCIHMHFQYTSRISDATTIESHVNDFFFHAGLISLFIVLQLKTAFAGFTLVAGPPVRLMSSRADSFSADSFGLVTVAAENRDSNHVIRTKSLSLRHDQFFFGIQHY